MEICFGIANRQILSALDTSIFYFQENNLSKSHWIFTKFNMCIHIVEICFGIAHLRISSIFDRVICPDHDKGGVLSFHVLLTLNRLSKIVENWAPVVQRVVSLTSSLRVISLTVLADSIHNILIFFAEKM